MFDKQGFKNILIKSRGNRNNKEYSVDSGVSRAYISGYINNKIANPPSPCILKKLAAAAHNSITYAELMHYAGLDTNTAPDELDKYYLKINKEDIKVYLTCEEQEIFYILLNKIQNIDSKIIE